MHEEAMQRTGADVTAGKQTEYQKTKGGGMVVRLKSLSLCLALVVVSLSLVGGASLPACLMKPDFLTLSLPRDGFFPLGTGSKGTFDKPCEVSKVTEWMRMPAGSRDLLVSADGPSGTGYFWEIEVGVALRTEPKPCRTLSLSTSTRGWRFVRPQNYHLLHIRWLDDLDADGIAELIIWDSFPNDGGYSGVTAWVYRLDSKEESLVIDWGLSRRMAREIVQAYIGDLNSQPKPGHSLRLLGSLAADALVEFAEERCTIATVDIR